MNTDNVKTRFREQKILVIGDLVADQFVSGTIDRVSREAPVFIMKHDTTETRAGGAANAAVNVASLGGKAVAVGLIGDDQNGESLRRELEDHEVDCKRIVSPAGFETTTKVRVLAGQHLARKKQVIRIDYESDEVPQPDTAAAVRKNALDAAKDADAIIISDYGYGVASRELFEDLRRLAAERDIPVLVDSRRNLGMFLGATSATPNQEEIEMFFGESYSEEECEKLREDLGLEALLLTRGNEGMLLVEKDKPHLSIAAVGSRDPVDVTGAGDTVIATYALCLASGMSFEKSARIANHAGGIVVMKRGTAAASVEELIESLGEERSWKLEASS